MIKEYYSDYTELGLVVIPIEWDIEKKQPVSHREWSNTADLKLYTKHNALMIKVDGVWAALDFDLKNTDNKKLFDQWKTLVLNQWPEIWNKLYIEKTRNNGYHVWIRYSNLEKKLSLADSDKGSEVIALYAKGPLVYTFPTPGYSEYSGSMNDVQDLTHDEFNYLMQTSQSFNEYKPTYDPNLKAVNYPVGYENLLSQFDAKITDEIFESILNDIGLFVIRHYKYSKNQHFVAFSRKGSESKAISAKVYYHSKRVCMFSASMHDYPNWHNRADYPVWSLPPSFILFYKLNRDWPAAIEYINGIIESTGIEIEKQEFKECSFPMHVFPDEIRRSIMEVSEARSLAPQFVATAGLWTISSLAGSMYESDFNGDGKNILFCLLIAPVSVGKTPAFRVMCDTPLKKVQEQNDKIFDKAIIEWTEKKDAATAKKKFTDKKPRRYIPIAMDGTTEGYIAKSMMQPNGIGVYQDEAETILNAGSFKSTNDSISFFTQAFSGGRLAQIRADETKERVVANLNLNLLMGTQPTRVKNIFTEDRLSSGFASRFLMVEADYTELNTEIDPFSRGKEMCDTWVKTVVDLYNFGHLYNEGGIKLRVQFKEDAKQLYRKYYKQLLNEANTRIKSKAESYIIGTEAKMSAYFPRLVQILAIMHSPAYPIITFQTVNDGWDLYRYYAESTVKVISSLCGEIETGLPKDLELLYNSLPEEFTRKEAAEICTRLNLKERRFDVSIRRKDFGALVKKVGQGKYIKI